MIHHIIFDLDDTLYLTEAVGFKIENIIAKEMGFKPMSRKTHQSTWGKPIEEIIAKRIPGINVNEFMSKMLVQIKEYVKKGKLDKLTEDTRETLIFLKKKGFKLSVLTSRTFKEVDHIFNLNHSLLEIIGEKDFYYKEKTEFYKPNPKVFNTILKSHAESPCEALYIGDTVIDAFAAKFAGLFFIATLESQLTVQSRFPQEMVDGFINKISDLQMYKSLFKTIKFNNLQNQVEILIDNQKFSVPQSYISSKHPKIKEILNSLLP